MADQAGASERQIQVRFITKQTKYAVTDTPIAVPISLRRYALSEIVNHLLGNESVVPFDFLVEGVFLHGSLDKHLAEKGISGETVVELEYFEALPPPEASTTFKADDWIASVHAGHNGLICMGLYDNAVSIWALSSGLNLASAKVHTAGVKCVRWVPGEGRCVSASQDAALIAWEVSEAGDAIHPQYIYKGHAAAVEGVAVSPSGTKFVSGSFDHTVKLWSLSGEEGGSGDEEHTSKKARTGRREAAKRAAQQSAVGTLVGHTNGVTAVAWGPNEGTVFSASWDHSIRQWDLISGVNTHTMSCQKAISAVACSPVSGLVASAGADKAVRVWDPRERDGPVVKLTLASHKEMTSCVAWSPSNANQLVSGGYDGAVKIWDIRSNIPLHTLSGHEDKVLCVDWSLAEYVLSGGADTELSIHNVKRHSEGA